MKKILLLATTIFCFSNLINAQAGQLDPSFGTNGIVKTIIGKSFPHAFFPIKQILLPSDGSIYSLHESSLTKRLSGGSVDSGYGLTGNGSSADAGFDINKAALQADGKIVVVGTILNTAENGGSPGGTGDIAVARFNTDGSLDSSFGGDGKTTTNFGEDIWDLGYAIAVQKDGKIVIMGGTSYDYLALVRYNTNGSLDSTFDGDGLVSSDIYNYGDPVHGSIAIQNDGKIVVAGNFSAVVRYNADGSFDKTFEENVKQPFKLINAVAIQSDGKTVVAAYIIDSLHFDSVHYSYPLLSVLARYNTDGSLDKSFSYNEKQTAGFGFNTIALQKDGKIVTGGGTALARFNADGSLDKTFSGDGRQTIASVSYISSIAIQNDGKIVTAGGNTFFRFTNTASLDKTFGVNGKLDYTPLASTATYYKTTVQKDGKILAAGTALTGSNLEYVITRYNTDGSLDNTFSKNGIIKTGIGAGDYGRFIGLAIQSDGKITFAGGYTLARYNTDGSLDNTFANRGRLTNSIIGANALFIQNDGKIVAAGIQNTNDEYSNGIGIPAVARYNADGSLDKTFGVNGKQIIEFDEGGAFRSVAVQNDGKIVVAGIFKDGPYDGHVILARLHTNGSFDSTFGYRGISYPGIGANSCAVVLQSDGKIVVAGSGDDHDTWNTDISRLNTDGSIDSSFHANGSGGYYKYAQNTLIALQNDGKIVVSAVDLSRYNTDGSYDTTFNANAAGEVDFVINDIAISGNKLYAAGGGYYGSVARYLLDNDSSNTPPAVILTAPADSTTYLAPAAHIKLSAAATDKDGTITKVEFYNGTALLHTETLFPYGYVWRNVGLGNYTITAKAYDNSGNVTTSAPVHISVVPNKPPIVSITSPADNQTFGDTATIHFEAAASDADGRITNVKFYSGTTLLRTEFTPPYTYNWTNAAAGTYTITAAATDNWGARTTSAPITITVINAAIVSSKLYSENRKTALNVALRLGLYPNPATNFVNLYTSGLKPNKPADISIISISGIVLKKVQTSSAAQMQVDVSSLAKGVYTIKIVSGDKVMFKQFVKL